MKVSFIINPDSIEEPVDDSITTISVDMPCVPRIGESVCFEGGLKLEDYSFRVKSVDYTIGKEGLSYVTIDVE